MIQKALSLAQRYEKDFFTLLSHKVLGGFVVASLIFTELCPSNSSAGADPQGDSI
jgi:hypothetical protein